jgi:hypothetical protein
VAIAAAYLPAASVCFGGKDVRFYSYYYFLGMVGVLAPKRECTLLVALA